jgi:4-carboxymuconolactone decarboxylase
MDLRRLILTASGALVFLGGAAAQERMAPIPADKMTEAQKKAAAELVAGRRGTDGVFGPFVPLLRSPELMNRAQKLGEYVRYDNVLGPRLNEMVILMTARLWTQQYEWNAHQPAAIKAGLKPEIVSAIAEGRRPVEMAEDEAIVYDFCMELRENKSVSDGTYARAVRKFGEQGVVDMVGTSGYYGLIAAMLNVSRVPLPEGRTPQLPALPR